MSEVTDKEAFEFVRKGIRKDVEQINMIGVGK